LSPGVKRIWISIAWFLGTLVALRLIAALFWPTINDVTTGATPEYPEIVTQRFGNTPEQTYPIALLTAKEMGWEIVKETPLKEIRAVATTPVFKFKDDVTITITKDATSTFVNVRSKSRIGTGDFGTNARRIKDFQQRLFAKLLIIGPYGPVPRPTGPEEK
jgi:uncharacterized protein (DUF1499 family)